jgi:hypothetical protein
MAWDPDRPVPWWRLTKEWLVFAAVMAVVFATLLRSSASVGSYVGLAASYPMYLGVGYVMAKMGRGRVSLAEGRAQRAAQAEAQQSATATDPSAPRPKPAPTRRTTTGPSQHPRRTSQSRRKR